MRANQKCGNYVTTNEEAVYIHKSSHKFSYQNFIGSHCDTINRSGFRGSAIQKVMACSI